MRYIIDAPSNLYEICGTLRVPVKVGEGDLYWYNTYLKVESYTEPDRKAIEDEVWELARRIICPSDCCEDSISAHTKEIFNKEGWEIRGIFNDLSYQEAKDKYEAWLKQKDEIHVGDEITYIFNNNTKTEPFVVVFIRETENGKYYEGIESCGNRWVTGGVKYQKTGRHFDEVAELLQKMRGEDE